MLFHFQLYEENTYLIIIKLRFKDMDAIKLGVILDNLLFKMLSPTPDGGSVRSSFLSQL